jgi:hypothetical protein
VLLGFRERMEKERVKGESRRKGIREKAKEGY